MISLYITPFFAGVILSILSGGLQTTNNFIINKFSVVVDDANVVRCTLQIITFLMIILYYREPVFSIERSKLILTLFQGSAVIYLFQSLLNIIYPGLVGAVSFLSGLASVRFMPVPDALCIIFSCPVVTIIFSACFLKERITLIKLFSGIILVTGVTLVLRPPFLFDTDSNASHSGLYFVGAALALTACVAGGLMDVLVKQCQVCI